MKLGVNSWLGHSRHSNSFNLAKKLFSRYKFIKVEHPDYYFGKRPKPPPKRKNESAKNTESRPEGGFCNVKRSE